MKHWKLLFISKCFNAIEIKIILLKSNNCFSPFNQSSMVFLKKTHLQLLNVRKFNNWIYNWRKSNQFNEKAPKLHYVHHLSLFSSCVLMHETIHANLPFQCFHRSMLCSKKSAKIECLQFSITNKIQWL